MSFLEMDTANVILFISDFSTRHGLNWGESISKQVIFHLGTKFDLYVTNPPQMYLDLLEDF